MDRKHFLRGAAGAVLALAAGFAQGADAWPSRPIRMIVPLAPGGGTDVAARVVAQYLGEALGQPIIIDNRVGANGVVGINEAARAAPDGYTFVIGSSTTLAANKFLYKSAASMDPFKEFAPLAILGTIDFALMVPASSNYHTVKDLVAAAKAAPGKLSYGYGTSAALLCGEMFNGVAGVDIMKVAYKGSPQSLTDLAADRVQLVCDPLGTSMGLIKAGKLRPLAITSKNRNKLDLNVPTMAEAGLPMEHETWAGFFVPAGVPKEIVQRYSTEIVKIMSRPDVQQKIFETGFVPKQVGAEEFGAIHRRDYVRMEELIKSAGIALE
ncbi:tripartite tricarboxylate transporter substrate binding protein [Ramlibacter sp. G-1-2-2]|uniref:Tripartite tricarboxylate transporter substrate binding protein n=1 Tax=Ramlibacter agri TaxID=2728837 RepID=A0A848HB72_9BURK|nr:tripartite tricarboxylate transporter substrate binding protein [Ramlibacter agri]NML45723.1 tripartite tricarboxylate transporter substrate binding protein [Ramlibacter agri]